MNIEADTDRLTLADLGRCGRAPELPLSLELPGLRLDLLRWLRVLPGRRYVALAEWEGRRVLAKLLIGRKARRHCRREREGAGWLREQGIPAPELLADGCLAGVGYWLLFDYLDNCETLEARWLRVADQVPLTPEQNDLLCKALQAIGAMHSRGGWQEDLHLGNLLWYKDNLHWVDVGTVRHNRSGQPLRREIALANLGLFFAQLPALFDAFIAELLPCYAQGGDFPEQEELRRQVGRARQTRLREFIKKTVRDCTLFSVRPSPGELRIVLRSEADALRELLDDPDRFIAAGEKLKNGNSATVRRVVLNGRTLVVKRYNIKNFWHLLGRFWRPSRAFHAWREGHRLLHLGIPTARPLAVVERRCCGLRRHAYLVLEYVEGEDLRRRFAPYVQNSPPEAEVAALVSLLESLMRERICHGDLKGSNLIWHAGRWVLVDLDAVHQCRSGRGFLSFYEQDRQRLLRNWPLDSALHRLLDARLPHVGRGV